MSPKIKLCSGGEAIKKFQKAGWTPVRHCGSHVMLTKPDYKWTLSVPLHKELGPGIIRKLMRQAGLTVEEFNRL